MASWVLLRMWDLSVSRAEFEEKGSFDLGVLALMGLPAKAWDWRLMEDMVEKRRRESGGVSLERERKREVAAVVVAEERNKSIGALSHLRWFLGRRRKSVMVMI